MIDHFGSFEFVITSPCFQCVFRSIFFLFPNQLYLIHLVLFKTVLIIYISIFPLCKNPELNSISVHDVTIIGCHQMEQDLSKISPLFFRFDLESLHK